MATVSTMHAGMPGMTMGATMTAAGAAGAEGNHHNAPVAPNAGDPRFINGSVGKVGESKTIKQKDGPAYGGQKVEKNQNNNDKEQQNYGVTDANFMKELGVIADPDTGKPQSYAQTMQSYNAAGALEALYPDVFAKLSANQSAGKGTVLGGALAIFGITKTDGANGASLAGIDDAAIGKIRGAQLGNLGTLKDYVLDTNDFKGREWNRAHHSLSSWTGMTGLVNTGYQWNEAALMTGDSMTSWSGRVIGSNNQDGNASGFADDELAGLKYTVLMEQATGKPALESILASHAATHLPEDQLTNPKINKFIGLPKDYRPKTDADRAMVASRIRQWALQPGVEVNQGEFDKFVKAGSTTAAGQALNASGLLNNVRFEAEEQNAGGGGGGGNNTAAETAATQPTGLGTGAALAIAGGPDAMAPMSVATTALTADAPVLAGGPIALTGSNTIDTRPTLADLGATGPYEVLDKATNKLSSSLQDQLMTAFLETLYQMNDSAILGNDEERSAFVDGAKKGVKYLKDAVAVDPTKVSGLKTEIAAALKDGTLTDEERTSLIEKLGDAGMDDVAASLKDGTTDEKELATIGEKLDGAASAKLDKDISAAMEDGTLSAEERTSLEGRLGKGSLDKLDAAVKDGSVTKDELTGISDAVKADGKTAADKAGATDAKAGADKVTDPASADGASPTAAADDAAAGAKGGGAPTPAEAEAASKDAAAGDKGAGATGGGDKAKGVEASAGGDKAKGVEASADGAAATGKGTGDAAPAKGEEAPAKGDTAPADDKAASGDKVASGDKAASADKATA